MQCLETGKAKLHLNGTSQRKPANKVVDKYFKAMA